MTPSPNPLRQPLGILLALGGLAVVAGLLTLTALYMALHSEPWSRLLAEIGIPTIMLSELAGLVGVFGGGAVVLAVVAILRRRRG